MTRPHLSALICFALAALLYFTAFAHEYAGAFFLLGGFFELVALKSLLNRKPIPPRSNTRRRP